MFSIQETWSSTRRAAHGQLTERKIDVKRTAIHLRRCGLPWSPCCATSSLECKTCLFTCVVVKAVHIEVVHSLDTDSFINALRRYINTRGCLKTIYSDNSTNFHAGERMLFESLIINDWNQRSVNQFLQQRKITWKFNPPAASLRGLWERTIRSMRKILQALLGQQVISNEMLQTLMI